MTSVLIISYSVPNYPSVVSINNVSEIESDTGNTQGRGK